ncbi:DUF3376 domain-containing protein [Streptomyces rishiriensis]|uniref:DUF3376 domain-containing protein n=1 Tax=Streptomyces rishiriensis TaxID=68264 RepID=UPI0037915395
MTENRQGRRDRSHEIRLALVLNGGVSLAVWMAGVVHELDLLRRASRGDARYFPEDEPIYSLWQEIAQKAPAIVRIDIISGTSAGGLNGMLLASNIARSAPMMNIRDIWKTSADLQRLLNGRPGHSILNGEFFEQTIKEAIDGIMPVDPSVKPVTLFLTATALGGPARHFKDAFEGKFDIRDHRRLYKFRHDPGATKYERGADGAWRIVAGGHDDLWTEDEGKVQSLVQAARATASYPVAFPPVREDEIVDNRIVPKPTLEVPASCVIDGGVLNNAPFEPVLDAIAERRLEGPVRRVVVYIVPSAGPLQEGVAPARCEETQWSSTVWSALNYPQEADIRSGVEILSSRLRSSIRDTQEELFSQLARHPRLFDFINQIGDLNELGTDQGVIDWLKQDTEALDRVRVKDAVTWEVARREKDPITWISEFNVKLYDWLTSDLREAAALLTAAIGLLPEYRRRRAQSVIWDVRSIRSDVNNVTSLITGPDVDAEEVLRFDPPWVPNSFGTELYMPDLENWNWGMITAERVLQMLRTHLHDLAETQQDRPSRVLTDAAAYISNDLRDALAVTDALRGSVRDREPRGVHLSDGIATGLLVDIFDEMNITRKMAELVKSGAGYYLHAINFVNDRVTWKDSRHAVAACLVVEVLTEAFAPVPRIVERLSPRFEFLRLGPDAPSPLFNTDRFSKLGDRKLYGMRMHHFGAFFDSRWRESDFTWGRMDAAHHMLRLLVSDRQERKSLERLLHARILEVEKRVNGREGSGEEWMRLNLEELCRSDSELVSKFLGSTRGRELLRQVIRSTLGMLGESHFNNRVIDARWQWLKTVGRSMFVQDEAELRPSEQSWKMRWMRRRTATMRNSAWEQFEHSDPLQVPKAVVESVQRDAVKSTAHLLPVAGFLSLRRRVLERRMFRRT